MALNSSPNGVTDSPTINPHNTDVPLSPSFDLEAVISESKENLASAEEVPVKRKRGRPRKSESPQSSQTQSTPDTSAPSQLVPVLKYVVKAPFQVAADRTGFKDWNLSDEESTELATLTDAVLSKYLPQLAGDKAAILTLVAALGAVTLSKWMLYREYIERETQKEHERQKEEVIAVHNDQTITSPFGN